MCCIKIALRRSFFEKTVQSIANGTDKGEIRRCKRRVSPFFFSAVKMKVLHKSAVIFEELLLIPQKSTAVRKQAGESRWVALLPLGGSQRTATPTAVGFVRYFEAAYIRVRGCSDFILADLGVVLFTAKTAA